MTGDSPRGAERRLREEVAALEVGEILALCYAFQHRRERLRLYLDVLRDRGGQRAQFASCLVCFDLARQGDPRFQREFAFIADTMREMAATRGLVDGLVGGDPYLSFLWELCAARLDEMDPRFEAQPLPAAPVEVASVELLSDADFADGDFEIGVEDAELRSRFDGAVEAFLACVPGQPVYDLEAGFRVRSKRDVERIESFLRELDSLREMVPLAAGYRALTLLFYGTHMRSKSLFGAVNQRKQDLLREGLAELIRSGPRVWEIAGVLQGHLHATPRVWERIAELVHDYCAWLALDPENVRHGPEAYDAVGRLLSRQESGQERRRER